MKERIAKMSEPDRANYFKGVRREEYKKWKKEGK